MPISLSPFDFAQGDFQLLWNRHIFVSLSVVED